MNNGLRLALAVTVGSLMTSASRIMRLSLLLLLLLAGAPDRHGLSAAVLWPLAQAAESDRVPLRPSVDRLLQSTVRILSGQDRCSGIVISDDGLILSAAHGLPSDVGESRGRVTVVLFDGRQVEGRVLYRNPDADIGLLELAPDARPELPCIRWNGMAAVTSGSLVLSAGCPGRDASGLGAVVRLGRVIAMDDKSIRTSCALTAGDSGGPLINAQGQLLGIHRRIGLNADSNHHIPLAVIAPLITKWTQGRMSVKPLGVPLADPERLVRPGAAVMTELRQRTVQILGRTAKSDADATTDATADTSEHAAVLSLGTVLGKQRVATKLSLLNRQTYVDCRFADTTTVGARVWRTDRSLDLAILKLDREPRLTTARNGLPVAPDRAEPECGMIVFANVTDSTTGSGILARVGHQEPSLVARLGAVLQLGSDGRLVVQEVAPNSTAAAAGLSIGDVLTAIDGQRVASLDDLAARLQQREPGDWWNGDVVRGARMLTLSAQLLPDPARQFEKSEFLDGRAGRLSARRSGFSGVLQHDVPMEPESCGGPLIDAGGRLLGVNIARRSRESTLTIPLDIVLHLADEAETP